MLYDDHHMIVVEKLKALFVLVFVRFSRDDDVKNSRIC